MSIVGMTKAPDGTAIAKLPRLGKLRKGAPKEQRTNKDGKKYEVVGKDLEGFRAEFYKPYEDLQIVWEAIYGSEPTEFQNVKVVGNTVDEAFENWREEWTASTMLHRCDGVNQVRHYDQTTHQYVNEIAPCAVNCGCKPRGCLKLLFPQFIAHTKVLGYMEVETHSINDIIAIAGYLTGIEGILGGLANVPFLFGRAPRDISTPTQEKQGNQYVTTGRATREKSLLYIQVMPNFIGKHLLPALNGEAPELPETVPGAASDPQQFLEAGDEPETPKLSDDASWMSEPGQPDKFLAWAKKQFDFDLEEVIVAFDNAVPYDVTNITQWRENKTVSAAAVVAAACDYDIKAVEKVTSQMNSFDIYMAADVIVARVRAESADEAEPVEG